MHKWDVDKALDIIERDQITHFIAVPTITGDLTRAAASRDRTLPSLLAIGGGGSHRPARQVLAIRDTFANAMPGTGWGMTETNAYRHADRSAGLPQLTHQQRPMLDSDGHENRRSRERNGIAPRRNRRTLGAGAPRS